MKVITPVVLTDAMLISSTAPEPAAGETLWNAATAYAVGDLVYRAGVHRRYRRLVAGTTATVPEDDTVNWAYIGGTNRWAMFDDTSAATVLASPLTVVLAPGIINSLAILGLVGTQITVSMLDAPAGATVYSETVSLETSVVEDWYSYFFEPFSTRQAVVLTDLPPYTNCRLTISLTGAGSVSMAHCIVGTLYTLGATSYGASAGIRDYSRKTTDEETGVVTLERRRFQKTLRAQFKLPDGAVNVVQQRIEALRATPVVWLGDNGAGIEPLIVYGYYRDFSLQLQGWNESYYQLEVEGMA